MSFPEQPNDLPLPFSDIRDGFPELREPVTGDVSGRIGSSRSATGDGEVDEIGPASPRGTLPEPDGTLPDARGAVPEERGAFEERQLEQLAELLRASGTYRVLRRLDLDRERLVGIPGAKVATGVALDVETTGLDTATCRIVELSLRTFSVDGNGRVASIGPCLSWLEDPGEPLSRKVSKITGLTDADLRGRRIDDRAACDVIGAADIRVAFNASYDRPVVERRLPAIRGLSWACAMKEVDWTRRGFDGSGRSLGWLLAQAGWWHGAHRASADVDATIAILCHEDAGRMPAFAEMMAMASQPGWRFRAIGASFECKDRLKERGYRWDGTERVWWREVADADRVEEAAWLALEVYAPWARPRLDGPAVDEVDWLTRHG